MTTAQSSRIDETAGDADQWRAARLWLAGAFFAFGTAIHTADHLRRGQGSVTEALYALGNVALVMQIVTVTLILTRYWRAPLFAVAFGFPLALGFAAAHWLPEWSDLSDPIWQVDSAVWFSYLASTIEIVGALAVGVTGLAIERNQGLASFGAAPPVRG